MKSRFLAVCISLTVSVSTLAAGAAMSVMSDHRLIFLHLAMP